jgi:hypothetical protein
MAETVSPVVILQIGWTGLASVHRFYLFLL